LQIIRAFFVINPQWIESDTTDVPGTTIERLAEVHGNRTYTLLPNLLIFNQIKSFIFGSDQFRTSSSSFQQLSLPINFNLTVSHY